MNQLIRLLTLVLIAVATAGILYIAPPNSDASGDAVQGRSLWNGLHDGGLLAELEISEDVDLDSLSAQILSKLGLNEEAAAAYDSWLWIALLLAVVIVLAMIFWPWQKTSAPQVKRTVSVPSRQRKSTRAAPAPLADQSLPEPATDKDRVLRFFFNLYREQIGADASAPSQVFLIETRPTCPNETYEIRVMQDNDWSSRRMSIGLLGQGGGSRSKCFYVIFDSHLVLKIPSEPISEFLDYQQQVEAEGRIVARLAPRECIVPRIGVILEAIHSFPNSNRLSEDELEKKYVQLAKTDPTYQKYLKIGSTFAFFMDLSKHFFLSSTLDEMHRGDQRMVSEALKNPELIWDQHGFVCRYGEEAGIVCQELQEAFYRSETRMRQLAKEARVSQEVSTFELKEWYLTHLAGEKVDPDAQDLPHELIERINRHMYTVVKNNSAAVEKYRQRVRDYIKETRFSQNRLRLENLATNTLSLLDWIGSKGLSLRDLKPENLFVAGDPNNYPTFLNDTMRFSIGLIDVETAVVVDADTPDDIPQPQLAGTPLYATPTHLLPNAILQEVYGDVRNILLLQDWYATIAIIFKIISGENLYVSTAKVFPEVLANLRLMDPAGPDLEADVARISRLFWNSAKAEFQEAIEDQATIFSRVEVVVPKGLIHDIVRALHQGSRELDNKLMDILSRQQIFVSREKCQFLTDAPAAKIGKMKLKLVGAGDPSDERSQQRKKAFDLLEDIEKTKNRLERKLDAATTLKTTGGAIAADQLLEAMFQKVFSQMHLAKWPKLTPAKYQGLSDMKEDITTYQATM